MVWALYHVFDYIDQNFEEKKNESQILYLGNWLSILWKTNVKRPKKQNMRLDANNAWIYPKCGVFLNDTRMSNRMVLFWNLLSFFAVKGTVLQRESYSPIWPFTICPQT